MSEDEYIKTNINTNPTRIDDDGIEMEWIPEMKAWVPKLSEEFIYTRNLNYGFIDNVEKTPIETEVKIDEKVEEVPPRVLEEWMERLNNDFLDECNKIQREDHILSEKEYSERWSKFYQENVNKYRKEDKKRQKEAKKRKAQPTEIGWFDINEDKNTFVYVENLPLDITMEEFVKEMSKVGMVMNDFHTHQPKAKLYKRKDDKTKNKGDGLVCYLKIESIDLAMDILDGSILRGNTIKVSRAKFEQKEDYVPSKVRRMTNNEKNKMRKNQEKLFKWTADNKLTRHKRDNTVIMKNMFDYELMKNNPEMVFEIKEKLNKELFQVGEVKNLQIYELHPEGVVQITFTDANISDIAVSYFNNKLWNGRKISAALWDGRTKYKIKETIEQENERLKNWDNTLGVDNLPIGNQAIDSNKTDDKIDEQGEETGDEDCQSD